MNNDVNFQGAKSSDPKSNIPGWLWNSVRLGFWGLVVGIAGLAIALAMGVADPKPVGNLKWEDHFANGGRWRILGENVEVGDQGLEIRVELDEIGGALTGSEGDEFTFEAAGGQSGGKMGAAYGIVFGYQNPESYVAVMINGNGYVEVISGDGYDWMIWQQWPNILLDYEANRIRVDVQNGEGLIRINDEVLITVPVSKGELGMIARGSADGQVVRFGWARLWQK